MRKAITLFSFLFLFASAYAQISIDGDMLDWAEINALDTGLPAEAYGNVTDPAYVDFNLKHVYITHDSLNVYVKIDLDDAASFSNFYNTENPPVFEFYLDTDIADTSGMDWGWWNNAYDYYVNLAPTLHPDSVNKSAVVYKYLGTRNPTYVEGEFDSIGTVPMAINDAGNQLEFLIPRNIINFGSEFRPWIYSVGDFQWATGASQLPLEGQTHMLKYDFWYGGSVYVHNGPQIDSDILIDGDLLDWVSAGIQPADSGVVAEELGDMSTGPEFDVQDIYLTSDSTYLYIRVDINPSATFAGIYNNYPNSSAFQLMFDVQWGDTTGLGYGGFWRYPVDYMVDLSAALHPDSTGNEVPVYKYIADWAGAFEEFAEVPEVTATFAKNNEDNAVEIAIPRAGLNMGTDVRPWLYVVGNEVWDVEEYVPNTVKEGWGGAEGEFYDINYNFINGPTVHRIGDKSVVTSVSDYSDASYVEGFGLVANYPNPFNPSTYIEFSVPVKDLVKVEVFDILGNKVATLVNDIMEAGLQKISWNGRSDNNMQVTSGVYIYKIVSGKYSVSKKMMLLK